MDKVTISTYLLWSVISSQDIELKKELYCMIKTKSPELVLNESGGIGKIDDLTIKAWNINAKRLETDLSYSVSQSYIFLDFLKQSYRVDHTRTWPCSFMRKYSFLGGSCERFLEVYNQCINEPEPSQIERLNLQNEKSNYDFEILDLTFKVFPKKDIIEQKWGNWIFQNSQSPENGFKK